MNPQEGSTIAEAQDSNLMDDALLSGRVDQYSVNSVRKLKDGVQPVIDFYEKHAQLAAIGKPPLTLPFKKKPPLSFFLFSLFQILLPKNFSKGSIQLERVKGKSERQNGTKPHASDSLALDAFVLLLPFLLCFHSTQAPRARKVTYINF